jgi:hypothetical protein
LEYRYAAVKLRKEYLIRSQNFHADIEQVKPLFSQPIIDIEKITAAKLPSLSCIYCVRSMQFEEPIIYVGETNNLRNTLSALESQSVQSAWREASESPVGLQVLEIPRHTRLSQVLAMLAMHETKWNAIAFANDTAS